MTESHNAALPATGKNVIPIRRPSIARLECSACGATADAACNCGAQYLPAGTRAAEAIAANPEKSDRAIATELKVSPTTVGKARKATVHSGQLAKRVGKDGKARKLPAKKPDPNPILLVPPGMGAEFNAAFSFKTAETDPLVIPDPESPEDQILASPWFASVMRPILEGKIKNDPKKSAAALVEFMRAIRQASATYLPQMTPDDLLGDDGARNSAANILDVVKDLEFDIEEQASKEKFAKQEAKRIKREAKDPQGAKEAARADAQKEALNNSGEEDEEKEANKGSGTPWSEQKEEWREEWISNNWGEEEQAEFEKDFAERWLRDHGAPFPGLDDKDEG